MSHIFISYAHDDKVHLDKLVAWLRENKFADHEIWYDHHLEAGNSWRDEINSALDEAFAVLAIVTKSSALSRYCVYEWAYAMGQNMPTIPLIFDEVSFSDVLAPLASKQFVNCIENIPDYLKEQVRRLKSTPPEVAAINKIVYKAIYDTHRRFFVLGWIGQGLAAFDNEFSKEVIAYFVKESSEAHKVLETLMIDKGFILNNRQHRYCWQLLDFLNVFLNIQIEHGDYILEPLFSQFNNMWLPAYEYFEGDGWWNKWIRAHFERNLENEHTKKDVFTEIIRIFPIFDSSDVDMLIHNKIVDQKRNQK